MIVKLILASAIALFPVLASAADPILRSSVPGPAGGALRLAIEGRAAALDGRTLWFPAQGDVVRLAGIDACELPQWGFNPNNPNGATITALAPVPCGAMAKAWLKRAIGSRTVSCEMTDTAVDGMLSGTCRAGGRDLAFELLRVGLVRLISGGAHRADYAAAQRYAMAARYGIWGIYVFDMNEWRSSAIGQTLDRRPVADLNLLRERNAQITPPLVDAGRRATRTPNGRRPEEFE